MARLTRSAALVCLPLLAAGCSDDSTGGFYTIEGVVYGLVTDVSGDVVSAASVDVQAFIATCTAPDPLLDEAPVPTSQGRYGKLLRGPHFSKLEACVRVTAVAEVSGSIVQGQVDGVELTLWNVLSGKTDSVRVDVTVR